MLCIILNCSTRSLVSLVTRNPVSNTSSSIWRPENFLCLKFTQQGFLCLNNTRHFLIAAVSRWEILKISLFWYHQEQVNIWVDPDFGLLPASLWNGIKEYIMLQHQTGAWTHPGLQLLHCYENTVNKQVLYISYIILYTVSHEQHIIFILNLFIIQITSFMPTSISSFPFILFKAWQLWCHTYKAWCQNFYLII